MLHCNILTLIAHALVGKTFHYNPAFCYLVCHQVSLRKLRNEFFHKCSARPVLCAAASVARGGHACSSGKGAIDPDIGTEGAIHRATVGDFEQASALLSRQVAFQRDDPLDAVNHAESLNTDLFMRQCNTDPGQRKSFAFGVHAQRHRGTGTQRGEQEVVRCRAVIGATVGDGFIGDQQVTTDADRLLVPALTVFADDQGVGDSIFCMVPYSLGEWPTIHSASALMPAGLRSSETRLCAVPKPVKLYFWERR